MSESMPHATPTVAPGRSPSTYEVLHRWSASRTSVGPSPSIDATGASGPSRRPWRSYIDSDSSSRFTASDPRTSRTREDFPEPDTPVTTVNVPFGMSTSTARRLFADAPRMRIASEARGRFLAELRGRGFAELSDFGGPQ